jgi:hypothetical protein
MGEIIAKMRLRGDVFAIGIFVRDFPAFLAGCNKKTHGFVAVDFNCDWIFKMPEINARLDNNRRNS